MLARVARNEFEAVAAQCENRRCSLLGRLLERTHRERILVGLQAREFTLGIGIALLHDPTGRRLGRSRETCRRVEQRNLRPADRIERLVGQRCTDAQELLGITRIGTGQRHVVLNLHVDGQNRTRQRHDHTLGSLRRSFERDVRILSHNAHAAKQHRNRQQFGFHRQ